MHAPNAERCVSAIIAVGIGIVLNAKGKTGRTELPSVKLNCFLYRIFIACPEHRDGIYLGGYLKPIGDISAQSA